MAFQLVLQKVTGMERDLKSIVSLLQKVITQLEVKQTEAEVPMATYEQLYPEMAEVAEDVRAADVLPPLPPPRRWYRWFLKKGVP
jgi:hypothetical protein